MSKKIVPAISNLSVVAFAKDGSADMGVLSNGVPFLSERGLARACGVSVSAVGKQTAKVGDHQKTSKIAETLIKQGFKGDHLFYNIVEKGTPVHAYPEAVCIAFVEHYAFYAGRYCTEQAREFARQLMRKSFRDFVYVATSYSPPEKPKGYLLGDIVLEAPKKWSLHFSKGWQLEAYRITRWEWQWSCMGGFILEHVYGWLPDEVVENVMAKRKASGKTKKLHQYFSVEVGEVYLRQQIQRVYEVLLVSENLSDFEDRMSRLKKETFQLVLF